MLDLVVIFSRAFSLRVVHSVAREVSRILPRVVLRRCLLQFTLNSCWVALNSRWTPAWEGQEVALNSWSRRDSPTTAADGGACGGVSVARRTAARADFVSRSERRHVWRGFFARQTAARGETLCSKEESEADRDFVSRYVVMDVSPIWREEESETHRRPKTAQGERPIGLCQVVWGLAKMPSFLPQLPTFPKYKTQIQNHWISQFELFGKLVKCKPQLQNRWRCS
jgi:hypothetical protein